MKKLLENDFPNHYGVGRRCLATEIIISSDEFDLVDAENGFVVPISSGDASVRNRGMDLSVINYESYLNKFDGTKMSNGKKRCDFIMTDVGSGELMLLCELTSTDSEMHSLTEPIIKKNSSGGVIVVFPGGKYQKAEMQLSDTLDNILKVPAIQAYSNSKKRKVCLMAYTIKYSTDETAGARNAFNRNRLTESAEAGENGAKVSSALIESFGYDYYRISHDYIFNL